MAGPVVPLLAPHLHHRQARVEDQAEQLVVLLVAALHLLPQSLSDAADGGDVVVQPPPGGDAAVSLMTRDLAYRSTFNNLLKKFHCTSKGIKSIFFYFRKLLEKGTWWHISPA